MRPSSSASHFLGEEEEEDLREGEEQREEDTGSDQGEVENDTENMVGYLHDGCMVLDIKEADTQEVALQLLE